MARDSEGQAGVLLTIAPLRGLRGRKLDACGHFAPNAPLPAQTARTYCFDGLPRGGSTPPRAHRAAGRLKDRQRHEPTR